MSNRLIELAEQTLINILQDVESSDAAVVSAAKKILEREEGKITVDNNTKTIYEEMPLHQHKDLLVPKMLHLPDKLMEMFNFLNDYKFIVLEGGRGSGKTQTAGRLVLALCEYRRVRVIAGRELETNIEESVHEVLSKLIRKNNLDFTIYKERIIHNRTGSEIFFQGMKEATSVNLKGLEDVDIVWMDEAETATPNLLSVLVPTPRKHKVLFIFTMNRKHRDDAVPEYVQGRKDAFHIRVNYTDNPFCPETLKIEAEECKARNEEEYRHVWLGEPRAETSDHIFNYKKLWDSLKPPAYVPEVITQRVAAIDVAGGGGDACVALVMERTGVSQFSVTTMDTWYEKDTMVSLGRVVSFLAQHRPNEAIVDAGGMGYVFSNRLNEVGVRHQRYDGASTNGVDTTQYVNTRAEAYWTTALWFDQGWIHVPEQFKKILLQLEKMKRKYRSDGRNLVMSKQELRSTLGGRSPDEADALVMAVWAAVKYLRIDSYATTGYSSLNKIKIVGGSIRSKTWRQ